VLGNGQAVRYGIGVGRDGFTWSGTQTITKKAQWPDWTPPPEMIARQPYLPRHMAGGPGNPLGARAMYLGGSVYRIHGTNAPETIGTHVSSGCLRLVNEDVIDLYSRVNVGTKVIVVIRPAKFERRLTLGRGHRCTLKAVDDPQRWFANKIMSMTSRGSSVSADRGQRLAPDRSIGGPYVASRWCGCHCSTTTLRLFPNTGKPTEDLPRLRRHR
jgi:hypothetical protein